MPHFKAFGMINLKYEIRSCQKIDNKGTMTKTSYNSFGQFFQFSETCFLNFKAFL